MLHVGSTSKRWLLALQTPDGTMGMQVTYRRHRRDEGWCADVQLVIEGVDRSEQARDDLGVALALLAGSDLTAPGAHGSPVRPAVVDPARFGSAQQRRSVVIRT